MKKKTKKCGLFLARTLTVVTLLATILLVETALLGSSHSLPAFLLLIPVVASNLFFLQLSLPVPAKRHKAVNRSSRAPQAAVVKPSYAIAYQSPAPTPVAVQLPTKPYRPAA